MNLNEYFQPEIVISKLRPYQKEAVDEMVKYINAFSTNQTLGTGLVAMPTGSGKTPIMGVIARCLKDIKGVLIISPRVAISVQLFNEIRGNLFQDKFEIDEDIPKTVHYFDKNYNAIRDSINDAVIITTIQKIDYLKRKKKDQYNFLLKNIKLVLFDEGHYEPAISWSETIRNFKCPRIIFSATPFRNDLKAFDIDWEHYYFTSYDSLLEEKYLRTVDFHEKPEIVESKDKINDILNIFDKKFVNGNAKVIINCDNSDSILEISKYLFQQERQFIAIHEAFTTQFIQNLHSDYKKSLRKKVPDHPEKEEAKIWIHQYKLLEGIDDHTFQMVAIYEPLRNVRSLIQQIGRVIRNPEGEEFPALVYNYTKYSYKDDWNKYLSIDKSGQIIKGFSESIFNIIDNDLPISVYFKGKLRDKLNLIDFKKWSLDKLKTEVRLPLKVNLLHTLSNFKFNQLKKGIEKRFKENDYISFPNPDGDNSILYFYFVIKNSSYVTTKFYPEIRHEVCFIKKYKGFIAFYDSTDYLPFGKDKIGIGTGISPDLLKRLFKEDSETVLTRVSLKNSNLGSREIRSHAFVAPSINDTTPFLNDFSHFLNSTFGYYNDKKVFKSYKKDISKETSHQLRTYVGFATGRISQNEPENLTFGEYLEWLEYIINVVFQKRKPISTFNRYASEQVHSKVTTPKNILIDLFEFENSFDFSTKEDDIKISEAIPDKCFDIKMIKTDAGDEKFTFNLKIESKTYSIDIKYDIEKKKYILNCPELSSDFSGHSKDFDNKTRSLITLLNEKQAFRIITGNNLIYSKGNFYNPFLKTGENFDSEAFQIQHVLFDLKELSEIGSEKGKRARNKNQWEENTLFNLIDTKGEGKSFSEFFHDVNFMICDDMGVEIADFIVIEEDRLIFIHAKGIGNKLKPIAKKCSASAISEVCNQAIKNLHYVSMFDDSKPTKLKNWEKPYINKNKRTDVDILIENRRRGQAHAMNAEEIWKEIAKRKFNPNVEREVWLMLGMVFSKSTFLRKLQKKKPDAVAVQAALTLQSTLANIGSMGAKLKVFCSS